MVALICMCAYSYVFEWFSYVPLLCCLRIACLCVELCVWFANMCVNLIFGL